MFHKAGELFKKASPWVKKGASKVNDAIENAVNKFKNMSDNFSSRFGNKLAFEGIGGFNGNSPINNVKLKPTRTQIAYNEAIKETKEAAEKQMKKATSKGAAEVENKLKPRNSPNPDATPSGPRTKISKKADEATRRSLERENEAADIFAKNGYEIEQNPKVEGTTREPDYRIEGELADCYSPAEKSSVRRIGDTIREKVVDKKQASRIVLNLKDWNGNINDIVEQLNNYPVEGLEEVIVVKKDNSIVSIYP
ncbi:hypothetical protein [Clostridium lundense]|uniref:CdiA C-terminal domain-containing protein n=1 Tax=Clostridium lundense TaxID=319475 RepID=UPI000688AD88|nr:hypothetical protein [Clostridium lundense]